MVTATVTAETKEMNLPRRTYRGDRFTEKVGLWRRREDREMLVATGVMATVRISNKGGGGGGKQAADYAMIVTTVTVTLSSLLLSLLLMMVFTQNCNIFGTTLCHRFHHSSTRLPLHVTIGNR